jgi:hypothetical protein
MLDENLFWPPGAFYFRLVDDELELDRDAETLLLDFWRSLSGGPYYPLLLLLEEPDR